VDATALLAEVSNPAPHFEACPFWAPPDDECHRVRGSPDDVHTPEGAARGYEFHRHCPQYTARGYEVVAVIGTGTRDFPPLSRPEREFWTFAEAVRRAAAVSSIHGISAYMQCFERPPFASTVVLDLHDWTQVDQAVRNIGSWLAAHDLKGEVILWPWEDPNLGYKRVN
jgi:hypothetical protein